MKGDFLHRQEGKKYLMPDFLSLKSKKSRYSFKKLEKTKWVCYPIYAYTVLYWSQT